MKIQVLHIVWCKKPGEAAGEIVLSTNDTRSFEGCNNDFVL